MNVSEDDWRGAVETGERLKKPLPVILIRVCNL
jgi:hypothetical protein